MSAGIRRTCACGTADPLVVTTRPRTIAAPDGMLVSPPRKASCWRTAATGGSIGFGAAMSKSMSSRVSSVSSLIVSASAAVGASG